MNTTKTHLYSALATFITTAVVVLGTQLSNGVPIEWTATWWFTVAMVAVRAGVKSVFETTLGQKI